MADRPERPRTSVFDDLPDQRDAPVAWDPQARAFVPVAAARTSAPVASSRPAAGQQWHIGAELAGVAPPARPGTPPAPAVVGPTATAVAPVLTPTPTPTAAPPPAAHEPRPAPTPTPTPAPAPAPAPERRRRRWLPRRPKLRWLVLGAGLLPIVLLLGGFLYANQLFGRVDRVEVGAVLDPAGGGGTNYLIVGSDSRDAVAAAGGTDPNVQPGGEAPTGQRSDTILLLRITPEGARTMSIPRDLFVTDAATGEEGRINGAFRNGPANLVQTVQQNLDVPVHRYIEVDFVTFSSLVDALGGITLGPEVVPHPAHDDRSGLNIGAGPVTLDGPMALAFVRSRHYTEVINGEERVDPTGDLGRITRQQAFLRTVLADAGASRNPLTLLRIARSVTGGLRIDDGMSLLDAVRFAWNMGRLNPEPVVLPTFDFRTSGGAAVLGLGETAGQVLDLMR